MGAKITKKQQRLSSIVGSAAGGYILVCRSAINRPDLADFESAALPTRIGPGSMKILLTAGCIEPATPRHHPFYKSPAFPIDDLAGGTIAIFIVVAGPFGIDRPMITISLDL